jgi:tRNA A37 methylthiotransferase MiaB
MLESEKIQNYLNKNKYEKTNIIEECSVIIIIGCSVIKKIQSTVISFIEKVSDSGKLIILSGCINEPILANYLNKIPECVYIDPASLDKLDTIVDDINIKFNDICNPSSFSDNNLCENQYKRIPANYYFNYTFFFRFIRNHRLLKLEKIYSSDNINNPLHFLTINIGCALNCSFCNTRLCLKTLKSKSIKEIEKEFITILKNDIKEIVLISEDIGSYGLDTESNLPELLHHLKNISKDYNIRLRLEGLNPVWSVKFEKELIPLIKEGFVQTITVPFQSGSNKVLELMNRYSNTEKIAQNIISFRHINPLLKINGVIMIGFPAENEEDLKKTLNMMSDLNIDEITITRYSEFEQCNSYGILPKVEPDEKSRRIQYARKYFKRKNIFVRN